MHSSNRRSSLRSIHRSLSASVACLSTALIAGCTVDVADEADGATLSRTDGVAQSFTMTCSKLTMNKGTIGAGQTAAGLATRDLTGEQDVWAKYVELSPRASATCEYALPEGVSAASLASLSIGVNYRGPRKSEMRWTFEAWDALAGSWTAVGDNAFASDWSWSSATLNLPAPHARFVSNGRLKIRYATTSNADSSALDQLVILGTSGDSAGGAGGTGGAGGAGGSGGSGGTGGSSGSGGSGGAGGSGGSGGSGGVWSPAPGTSWQWQLTGAIDTSLNVAMYDIDLFDAPQATINSLRAAGKKVICYFSAGSYEDWRSDASSFPAASLGNPLDGWPGERWIDTRNAGARSIMKARLDLAVSKKCDGVEPDNVDGYLNKPGFPLTASTQLDYNIFLAQEAHARGLSIGLKNDLDQVAKLVPHFDWALNEECHEFGECEMLTPFITAGKAVFHVEYGAASLASTVCPDTKPLGFSTLIKELDLGGWRVACP